MSLATGTRLGPYQIETVIGAGGMGDVYRALDTRLERVVALKVLPARVARDPIALERFHREARVIASVNHPHICAIYDVGEYEGSPYLVMELLEGSTLHERLENKGQPVEQLIEWGMQLAGALEAAHARGIVHRDLKPANIIVTARGDVKVLDFGIAKLADGQAAAATTMAALTDVGAALGTAAYMAPEQVRGESLDQRADLFALGVVLYEVATGRRAFPVRRPRARRHDPESGPDAAAVAQSLIAAAGGGDPRQAAREGSRSALPPCVGCARRLEARAARDGRGADAADGTAPRSVRGAEIRGRAAVPQLERGCRQRVLQ
jgi:serine/threonine protein kinase